MATTTVSVDEFQALEQRVQRAVELIKTEREARSAAESEVRRLKDELERSGVNVATLQVELAGLKQERESVKTRVDSMLSQLDELL